MVRLRISSARLAKAGMKPGERSLDLRSCRRREGQDRPRRLCMYSAIELGYRVDHPQA